MIPPLGRLTRPETDGTLPTRRKRGNNRLDSWRTKRQPRDALAGGRGVLRVHQRV